MNRIELTEKIREIYQETLDSHNDKLKSSELSKASSSVFLMEKMINKTLSEIGHEITEDIPHEIDELVEKLKEKIKSKSPNLTYDGFKEECSEKADRYIDAVKKYTNAGNTGFYDIGMRLHVTYKPDVKKVQDIIKKMQEDGDDVVVVDEIYQENKDHSRFGNSASISIMLPSSLYEKLDNMLDDIMDKRPMYKTSESVTKQQYFISPMINQIESLTVKHVQNTIKHYRDTKDSSWDVETGFAALGYARFELKDWSRESVKEKVETMLTRIDLYSNRKGEHENGIMSTVYCYDKDEIENCKMDTSKFKSEKEDGKIYKTVNIVDDLKLHAYNQLQQSQKRKVKNSNSPK